MPTPREMRGQVYCAIVIGATGIIYFAFDSEFTRGGEGHGTCIGPRALLNMSFVVPRLPFTNGSRTPLVSPVTRVARRGGRCLACGGEGQQGVGGAGAGDPCADFDSAVHCGFQWP